MDDSAAYAVNWWVVLAADALMGVVVALAGVAALLFWNVEVGAVGLVGAIVYLALVGFRALRWSRLRRAGAS